MFSSRIDRTGFFIGIMAYFIVLLPLYIYFISISLDSIFYYVFILPIITGMSLPVRRLHDMGLSGWACLLLFMPLASAFVLFALLVFKSKNENNPYGSPQAPRDFVGILFGRRSNNESVQLSAPVTPIAPAMNPAVVTGNYYHVNRGSREYVAIALLAATGLMVLCFVAMVAISAGLDEHSPSAEEFNAFGMVFLNFVLLLTIGDVIWGIYGLKEAGANTNSRYHVALMTVGLIVLVLDLILHI